MRFCSGILQQGTSGGVRTIKKFWLASDDRGWNGFENRVYFSAIRRERADGIRCGSVAGKEQGLAAAAAEILRTAFAGFARFFHPCFAAKFLKRFALVPNVAPRPFLHVVKL